MANESLDQRLSQIMPAEVEQQLPADLTRADVELKYEWYPKSGENISISAFGKNFIKPIEQR